MSNGSESTPERCVHAVDGPDWAGLRELKVDPWEGFTGQSEADAADAEITDPLLKRIHELEAENEKLRKAFERSVDRRADLRAELNATLDRVRAERDALQARLDAMTVEWANWIETASAHVPGVTVEQVVDALRSGRQPWGISGPTVVPEGDANA